MERRGACLVWQSGRIVFLPSPPASIPLFSRVAESSSATTAAGTAAGTAASVAAAAARVTPRSAAAAVAAAPPATVAPPPGCDSRVAGPRAPPATPARGGPGGPGTPVGGATRIGAGTPAAGTGAAPAAGAAAATTVAVLVPAGIGGGPDRATVGDPLVGVGAGLGAGGAARPAPPRGVATPPPRRRSMLRQLANEASRASARVEVALRQAGVRVTPSRGGDAAGPAAGSGDAAGGVGGAPSASAPAPAVRTYSLRTLRIHCLRSVPVAGVNRC